MLHKAATAAIQWNADMAGLYARLKQAGKKHEVALVAVMRKRIIPANVLLRDGREWAWQAPQTVGLTGGQAVEKSRRTCCWKTLGSTAIHPNRA